MKQEVPPAVLFGAIAAVVLVLGFFLYKGIVGEKSSAPSDIGMRLSKVIERTNGDVSKMTPEEKKVYDEAISSGYYRPGGSSGRMSSSGQTNAPGAQPSAPRYPGGSNGSRPGTSGSYPAGSSGSYPSSSSSYPAGSSGAYPAGAR